MKSINKIFVICVTLMLTSYHSEAISPRSAFGMSPLDLLRQTSDVLEDIWTVGTVGYRFDFLPDNQFIFTENETRQNGGGGFVSLTQVCYSYIAVDATAFIAAYTVDSPVYSGDTFHKGWEAFVDFFVPVFGSLDGVIYPYAGIGYQKSTLTLENDNLIKSIDKDAMGTRGMLAKLGVKYRYHDYICVSAEFIQDLNSNNNKLFSAFEIGIGLALSRY